MKDLGMYSSEILKRFRSATTLTEAFSIEKELNGKVLFSDVEYLFVRSGLELLNRNLADKSIKGVNNIHSVIAPYCVLTSLSKNPILEFSLSP